MKCLKAAPAATKGRGKVRNDNDDADERTKKKTIGRERVILIKLNTKNIKNISEKELMNVVWQWPTELCVCVAAAAAARCK